MTRVLKIQMLHYKIKINKAKHARCVRKATQGYRAHMAKLARLAIQEEEKRFSHILAAEMIDKIRDY
jgi:hypothetical protein